MKFICSSAFLLICFAASQASPFVGLGAVKNTVGVVVDTNKKIASGIASDIGRVTSDLKEIGGKVTDINAIVANLVNDGVAKLLNNLANVFEHVGKGISSVEDSINAVKNKVGDRLKNIFNNLAGESLKKIQDITGQAVENKQALIDQVKDGVSNLVDNYLKSFDSAVQGVKDMKDKLAEKNREIAEVAKAKIQNLITDFVTATKGLSGFGKNIAAAKQKAIEDLANGIAQIKSEVTKQLEDMVKSVKDTKEKIMETQIEKARDFVEEAGNLMNSVAEKFVPIKEKVADVKEKLGDLMAGKISSLAPALQQGLEAILLPIQGVQDFVNNVAGQALDMVSSTVQGIADLAVGSFKGIFGGLKSIGSGFLDINKNIADKVQNVGGKVIDGIVGSVNNIKDVGGKMVETKKNLIKDATEQVNSLVKNTVEQVKAASSNIFRLRDIAGKFTAVINKLINGVMQNVMIAAQGAEEIRSNILETQKEIGSMVKSMNSQLLGDVTKNIGVGVDTAKTIAGNMIKLPASLLSG